MDGGTTTGGGRARFQPSGVGGRPSRRRRRLVIRFASLVHAANLTIFRRHYPRGETFVVAQDVDRPSVRTIGNFTLAVAGLKDLIERLGAGRSRRGATPDPLASRRLVR